MALTSKWTNLWLSKNTILLTTLIPLSLTQPFEDDMTFLFAKCQRWVTFLCTQDALHQQIGMSHLIL